MPQTYHHGDLRPAVLDAAVQAIAEGGPSSVTLRDLARRVGVSHAAPAHHFGDRTGLFTAVAAQGFDLLTEALEAASPPGDLTALGVAYVEFAIARRAHFDVMFRADLHHQDDPGLLAAQERSHALLSGGVAGLPPERRGGGGGTEAATAAWSFVHGFATLWLQGALPSELGNSPAAAVRATAASLFRGP